LANDVKAQAPDLFGRFSPRNGEAKLDRPLFLFYAQDDRTAPELDALAARLKSMNKPVDVVTVPNGGHYDPMIRDGIPAAIAWLDQQRGTAGR
jgi:pimeloyl-ACP methyl ester carboxylesterase